MSKEAPKNAWELCDWDRVWKPKSEVKNRKSLLDFHIHTLGVTDSKLLNLAARHGSWSRPDVIHSCWLNWPLNADRLSWRWISAGEKWSLSWWGYLSVACHDYFFRTLVRWNCAGAHCILSIRVLFFGWVVENEMSETISFLAHGWRSHSMNGTHSLNSN